MKSILICGEGSHDVGEKSWDSKTGTEVYFEGWLQPLMRKVIDHDVVIKPKRIKELVLFKRPSNLKPIPKGHSDKAAISRLIARIENCDGVIFATDADTNDEAERRAKVKEIGDGFALIDNDVKAIPCVPRSMSECWLLSDEDAWEQHGLTEKGNFPKTCPEDLWGKRNDSDGNHPKHVFNRVTSDAGVSDNRDTRSSICAASSLEIMRERCPTSLKEFIQDLQAAVEA